jgi:FAD/FMN-containing dehydrogenase
MQTRTFRNWNGSATSSPSAVVKPRTLDELIAVVKDQTTYPSPVRAAGSFHSLNACFVTTGTQVLMRRFTDIRVDLDARTITVGAGVKMIGIRDALRPRGMQTEVAPEIGSATAGSVSACGTKDASIGRGLAQVGSTVIAVKLVNPNGDVEEVSEDSDPERMRVIRSS